MVGSEDCAQPTRGRFHCTHLPGMGPAKRHQPLRGSGVASRPAREPDRGGTLPMMATIPEGVKVFSVTELTSAIEGTLHEAFPSVWVSGEVSNVSRPSSG